MSSKTRTKNGPRELGHEKSKSDTFYCSSLGSEVLLIGHTTLNFFCFTAPSCGLLLIRVSEKITSKMNSATQKPKYWYTWSNVLLIFKFSRPYPRRILIGVTFEVTFKTSSVTPKTLFSKCLTVILSPSRQWSLRAGVKNKISSQIDLMQLRQPFSRFYAFSLDSNKQCWQAYCQSKTIVKTFSPFFKMDRPADIDKFSGDDFCTS